MNVSTDRLHELHENDLKYMLQFYKENIMQEPLDCISVRAYEKKNKRRIAPKERQ